jgi:hypothetical protein
MSAVLFFVVIMMPEQALPLVYMQPVDNYEACISEQRRYIEHPTRQLLLHSGRLQMGCTVTYQPSEEH